jgi:hypothetical protein
LIPETVYREVPNHGFGSMQRFAHHAVDEIYWHGRSMTTEENYLMTILDLAIGNTDREPRNWMRMPEGAPVAIDHGYSFAAAASGDPGGLREFKSIPARRLVVNLDPLGDNKRMEIANRIRSVNVSELKRVFSVMSDTEATALKWRLNKTAEALENNKIQEFSAQRNGS